VALQLAIFLHRSYVSHGLVETQHQLMHSRPPTQTHTRTHARPRAGLGVAQQLAISLHRSSVSQGLARSQHQLMHSRPPDHLRRFTNKQLPEPGSEVGPDRWVGALVRWCLRAYACVCLHARVCLHACVCVCVCVCMCGRDCEGADAAGECVCVRARPAAGLPGPAILHPQHHQGCKHL